jgi:hypothetical protein
MQYEAPEVMELGDAEDMIFGVCGCACDGACSEGIYHEE